MKSTGRLPVHITVHIGLARLLQYKLSYLTQYKILKFLAFWHLKDKNSLIFNR